MNIEELYTLLGQTISNGIDHKTEVEIAFDYDIRHTVGGLVITKSKRIVLCDESELDVIKELSKEV